MNFKAKVEKGMEGFEAFSTGFSTMCSDCRDAYDICCEYKAEHMLDNGEIVDEPHFSWRTCEICGDLPGDRYAAHALDPHGEIVHFDICSNCLQYIANGTLPEGEEDDKPNLGVG